MNLMNAPQVNLFINSYGLLIKKKLLSVITYRNCKQKMELNSGIMEKIANIDQRKILTLIICLVSCFLFVSVKANAGPANKNYNYSLVYTFDLSLVGVNVLAGQITNTTSAMKYSLNSTNGADGDWITASDGNTSVNYRTGGFNVWVREASNPSNNRKVAVVSQTPNFSVNFRNETTASAVLATIEYSLNPSMINPVSGTGTPVLLLPGNTYYFRTKATASAVASPVQTIVIPERPVTPSYSIDFFNESTGEPIKETDEYSSTPEMSVTYSGNGAQKNLYPGQTLYFRTKATNSRYKSLVQALVVPARPATPVYSIDFQSEATREAVASTDEYSFSSSMGTRISGNGISLALQPGTNLFFRKKATSVSFRSLVQELVVPQRPAAPLYTMNFYTEKTNQPVASTHEYATTELMTNAADGAGAPITILPGQTLYFRIKSTNNSFRSAVTSLSAPNRPAVPYYSINFVDETTNEVVSATDEFSFTANMSDAVSGVNQKIALSAGCNLYFRVKATESSFKSAIFFLAVPVRPDAPVYTIDYQNEVTNEQIAASHMFSSSSSLSDPVEGNDEQIRVTPGQNLYFFKKATVNSFKSNVLTLMVPARPTVPAYAIDYKAETTSQAVPSSDVYSFSADMSASVAGTGTRVRLMPGKNTYFMSKATSSSFKSEVQLLTVPERPLAGLFSIDYRAEKTFQIASTQYEYSLSSLMVGANNGIGEKVNLIPGSDLYIRLKATDTTFCSVTQMVNVPERSKIAGFNIDYVNEKTLEPVNADIAYGMSEDMSGATAGSGKQVALNPGMNMYFWALATDSSFRSEISMLEVPQRPSGPSGSSVDMSQRALDWNLSSIYSDISDYEYSYSGSMSWKPCDIKPLQLTKSTTETSFVNLRIKASNEPGKERFSSEVAVIENPLIDPEGSDIVIRAYPNPMTDMLVIDADPTISARPILKITDSRGNVVVFEDLIVNHKEINVSALPQGLYVITVTAGGVSTRQKILKR